MVLNPKGPNRSNRPHHPHWGVAAILSLVSAGAGQYYAGSYVRAWTLAALLVCASIAARAFAQTGPSAFYLATALGLILTVAAAVDALRVAQRAEPSALPPLRRWLRLLAFVVVVSIGYQGAQMGAQRLGWAGSSHSYSVPSQSMAPTILRGDHVLADLNAYRDRPIERGDVVVFEHPNESGVLMLKRVIGIAGDTIEMKKRELWINGAPVKTVATGEKPKEFERDGAELFEETINGRTYRVLYSNNPLQDHFKAKVGEGAVYLLGDHRDFSHDSRFWGPVSVDRVLGKALFTYFRFSWEDGNRQLSLSARWIK
jgi:signal peptidase I